MKLVNIPCPKEESNTAEDKPISIKKNRGRKKHQKHDKRISDGEPIIIDKSGKIILRWY